MVMRVISYSYPEYAKSKCPLCESDATELDQASLAEQFIPEHTNTESKQIKTKLLMPPIRKQTTRRYSAYAYNNICHWQKSIYHISVTTAGITHRLTLSTVNMQLFDHHV